MKTLETIKLECEKKATEMAIAELLYWNLVSNDMRKNGYSETTISNRKSLLEKKAKGIFN
jgi:hypothetical protein